MSNKKAIVIGAGIVGLATARALAIKGYSVHVFEKTERAVGASIRNFGMLWPIGQPLGKLYDRAIRTRNIWKEICTEAQLWFAPKGSLQLAYETDEWQVVQEFVESDQKYRDIQLLSAKEILAMSQVVNPENLKGGFFSGDEVIVNPRQVINAIPAYFTEKYGIEFHFNTVITEIQYPTIWSGNNKYNADEIYLCSGPEFEFLYPQLFAETTLSKCKLQMMRTVSQGNFQIGPSVCGGLTLLHYKSFSNCPSLQKLNSRINEQSPDFLKYGIHVMISQNGENEITIGDSHEYGLTHDPFNRKEINDLILNYLYKFTVIPHPTIDQSWIGIYPKMMNGATELILKPEEGVTIINGLGGNGMTLSFGLLEEVLNQA